MIVHSEDAGWFVGDIEGGGSAAGRSLAEVANNAKEVVILMQDLPDDADVTIQVIDGD